MEKLKKFFFILGSSILVLLAFLLGLNYDLSDVLYEIKSWPKITWLGFYYEDGIYQSDAFSQRIKLEEAPRFSSIQTCINWGNALLSKNPRSGFECSYGCRYEKEWQSTVCKDTTKMITTIKKEGVWDRF